jgi:hypothetical protein
MLTQIEVVFLLLLLLHLLLLSHALPPTLAFAFLPALALAPASAPFAAFVINTAQ